MKGDLQPEQRLELGLALASSWLEQYNADDHSYEEDEEEDLGRDSQAIGELHSAIYNGRKPAKDTKGCSLRHLKRLLSSNGAVNEVL